MPCLYYYPWLANDIDFDSTMVVNLILSIFPTNLFTPFVDNNYPQLAGISVSSEFLLVLFLLTMQLALASPGMIPGITILLKALGLPMGFVGLFSAYNVFVMNANVAFCVFFQVLEQLEAAIELKQIDSSFLHKEASS